MKILTLTSLFPNSVRPDFGIFVHQRVSHLASRSGNVLRTIAPVPYFPSWVPVQRWHAFGQVPREESFGGLKVFHPRYPLLPEVMPLHGLLMFLGCLRLAARLHREITFDCIDAHYVYPDGFAGVLLGKALGIPVIVSVRGTDINLFPSFRLIRPMIRWTLRRSVGVIAVSQSLQNAITELGVPRNKVAVIGNGIDPRRFQFLERTEARRQLGLAQDGRIALSVGSLLPVKCHELLISATAQLTTRHPDLRLYIAGEGPMRPKLEALILERGMSGRIALLGNQPNERLGLWFNAADISCLSSSREGWPNVVSESIACGTPVVATRVGGVAEIITSEELGILVDANEHSIAAGLAEALAKTWDRHALARHGQRRTWGVVAEEVENFISARMSQCKTNC
jgi:teichuronic acid biosynthesis glycosyltransferase TuaC